MKKFYACDPGKDGAIVMITEDKLNVITVPYPLIAGEYDLVALRNIFSKIDPSNAHMVIENVHAIAGGSAKANWSFSRGKTMLEVFCVAYDIPFTFVNPKVWQKETWEGISPIKINTGKKTKTGEPHYKVDTKNTSLLACKRLFPNVNLIKPGCRTPHEGIVDALLMAEYCRRKFK
jgi:hypothetical protein